MSLETFKVGADVPGVNKSGVVEGTLEKIGDNSYRLLGNGGYKQIIKKSVYDAIKEASESYAKNPPPPPPKKEDETEVKENDGEDDEKEDDPDAEAREKLGALEEDELTQIALETHSEEELQDLDKDGVIELLIKDSKASDDV